MSLNRQLTRAITHSLTRKLTDPGLGGGGVPTYSEDTWGDSLIGTEGDALVNAVDDAAAATAGVPVGQLYRNGSVLMIRVT